MNALRLSRIVADELAAVGIADRLGLGQRGRPRITRWSSKQPGFGVRHYASGRRVYVVQTMMEGQARTITIGNTNILTEGQALDVARRVLLRAQVGENPAAEKKRRRGVPSYGRFLALYWEKMEPKWKPSTRLSQMDYRRNYLATAFPDRLIDEIEQADIARWFADASNRGGPGAGNRCFEIMRAMMNKAEAWGYRPEGSNPCTGIRANKRRKCERFLSEQEIARLGQALDTRRQSHPLQSIIIYLLLLTGCRKSEIVNLRWSEVKGRRLLLSDSKTGPRTVWLGDDARQLLDCLPRKDGQPIVFWDRVKGRAISSVDDFWRDVRQEAGLQGVRLHDLRHSFASHAAAKAETLPMIGKLLGHAKIATTARYAHLDDGQVLEAAERVGMLTAKAMGEFEPPPTPALDPRTILNYIPSMEYRT